jgi:hypothetical protein
VVRAEGVVLDLFTDLQIFSDEILFLFEELFVLGLVLVEVVGGGADGLVEFVVDFGELGQLLGLFQDFG